MDTATIKHWATNIVHIQSTPIIISNNNSIQHLAHIHRDNNVSRYWIDLANVTTEEDNLIILDVILRSRCQTNYPLLTYHYCRMNFTQCLQMLLTMETGTQTQDFIRCCIIIHAFHNIKMPLLEL